MLQANSASAQKPTKERNSSQMQSKCSLIVTTRITLSFKRIDGTWKVFVLANVRRLHSNLRSGVWCISCISILKNGSHWKKNNQSTGFAAPPRACCSLRCRRIRLRSYRRNNKSSPKKTSHLVTASHLIIKSRWFRWFQCPRPRHIPSTDEKVQARS